MSFYQEFETPPPLDIDDDDSSSKLEEGDFNDADLEHFNEEIDIPGIPQHHPFYSSSPPPDDDIHDDDCPESETSDPIELPPLDDIPAVTTGDCEELVQSKATTTAREELEVNQIVENQVKCDDVIKEMKSVTNHACTEIESAIQDPVKVESLKPTSTAIADDPEEFHFGSFKIEDLSEVSEEEVHVETTTTTTLDKNVKADEDEDEFEFESFKAVSAIVSNSELSQDHFESFKAKGFSESDDFVFESYRAELPAQQQQIDMSHSSSVKVEQEQQEQPFNASVEDDFQFEADFSNFEAAFPETTPETFSSQTNHSIQSNHQQESMLTQHALFEEDDDDEDDFGDFSDFTQAPTAVAKTEIELPPSTLPSMLTVKPDVVKIFDQSFPYEKTEMWEEDEQQKRHEETKVVCVDNLMKYLKDIDVTLALNYDYKDSCTHNILVKALGIDKRNILFGPKWNSSSSSNVPRFASDLSFNPLQPQKSSSSSSSASSSSLPTTAAAGAAAAAAVTLRDKTIVKDTEPIKQLQQPLPQPDVIPEVEFDWNGAGLKNPLDAKQLKPTNELLSTKINSVAFESNFSKSEKVNATEEETVKHVWQDEAFDHVIVRERVIKLPETHIFTPIKSISPVAVSKDISLDESKGDKTSVYVPGVKEYHDVEYSLEPQPPKYKNESESDFDEFQSAVVVVLDVGPKAVISGGFDKIDILMPQGSESFKQQPSVDILKPTEFFQPQSILKPQQNSDLLMPQKVNYTPSPSIQQSSLEKTPSSDDFDFTEFQAAPCVVGQPSIVVKPSTTAITTSPAKEKEKINSITLSPMHLVNSYKASNAKSDNKSKYLNNSSTASAVETNVDDDWSDFVSSSTTTTATAPLPRSNNDSVWSDFVSVPSIKNSSQFPSKPNFSSWNQPISRPYAVNHSTSFLSSYQPTAADIGERKMMMTTNKPMNITNNFNYGVDQCAEKAAYQHGMSNGISTILPDLQFAMPNNLINLSRANSTASSTSGKK